MKLIRDTKTMKQKLFKNYNKVLYSLKINEVTPYFHTLAFSKAYFYSPMDYVSYHGVINIIKVNNKLKFRFSYHENYDGLEKCYMEDCDINFNQKLIKLKGYFATNSGILQLYELVDYVLNNKNDRLNLNEINNLKELLQILEKEII